VGHGLSPLTRHELTLTVEMRSPEDSGPSPQGVQRLNGREVLFGEASLIVHEWAHPVCNKGHILMCGDRQEPKCKARLSPTLDSGGVNLPRPSLRGSEALRRRELEHGRRNLRRSDPAWPAWRNGRHGRMHLPLPHGVLPRLRVVTPAFQLAQNGKSGVNMPQPTYQIRSHRPQVRHKAR
jgi:hypothetical protein